MWLLENDGEVFGGRRLWLRPGKRYLFGRTSQEAGQLVIQDKTISRKHLTITVDPVPKGDGVNLRSRSTVTIEDLGTKLGTKVNGESIKGQRRSLTKDENEIKLGNYKKIFRITWHPIVFSFSFTKAELERNDPWDVVRRHLEPLDIKYISEYDYSQTTHVVSKKRSTSKILQALINGKYVVSDGFLEAILKVSTTNMDENDYETSPLEQDFEKNWPDALSYLPPKGDAPGNNRPDSAYAPDERRREIFDGYTFIFYDKRRFDELLPTITSGKGKVLLNEAVPGETDIDEFIRYVKGIAGEKGLGEFEDGSEGRGVVVVRYLPPQGDQNYAWFLNLYNEVATRLDHRPIELRDILPAILDVEPSQLRKPLEPEPTPRESGQPQRPLNTSGPGRTTWSMAGQNQKRQVNNTGGGLDDGTLMEVDGLQENEVIERTPPPPPRARRGRERAALKSRFKGFDVDSDGDEEENQPDAPTKPSAAAEASQGMFITQPEDAPSHAPRQAVDAGRSSRKRPAPEPDHDIMEEVAPTAAMIKRLRIEGGEDPLPRRKPTSQSETATPEPPVQKEKGKGRGATEPQATTQKRKKGTKEPHPDADILDKLVQTGQEEDASWRAEQDLLKRQLLDGDIDFDNIRKHTTVEHMEIRRPQASRSHEQDIQEGRWDPRWNGRKNFKKFRTLADEERRGQTKKIISLEAVKPKAYGIGDEYRLEKKTQKGPKKQTSKDRQSQKVTQVVERSNIARARNAVPIGSDTDEDDDDDDDDVDHSSLPAIEDMAATTTQPSRSRRGKAVQQKAGQASQKHMGGSTQNKRAAEEAPASEKPSKRRAMRSARALDDSEDDDSDDGGLYFRFGKRR